MKSAGTFLNVLDALKAAVDDMPTGMLLFSPDAEIIYFNNEADLFMQRMSLPEEVPSFCRLMFDPWRRSKPFLNGKEIILRKKPEGSLNYWLFRFRAFHVPLDFVGVYLTEESVTDRLNLDEVRRHYRLTRREVDVVRCMLRGLAIANIAQAMGLKEQTVREYLSNIYLKLEVSNKCEATSLILGSSEFYYSTNDQSTSSSVDQTSLF